MNNIEESSIISIFDDLHSVNTVNEVDDDGGNSLQLDTEVIRAS